MHITSVAHSFLAILAGFITVIGLMGIGAALTKRLFPNSAEEPAKPDHLVLAIQIVIGFFSSLLGGYVTARYTHGNLLVHTLMMALAILFMSGLSAVQMRGKQPLYYLLFTSIIPPLAVLGGGLLRLRQMGLHW